MNALASGNMGSLQKMAESKMKNAATGAMGDMAKEALGKNLPPGMANAIPAGAMNALASGNMESLGKMAESKLGNAATDMMGKQLGLSSSQTKLAKSGLGLAKSGAKSLMKMMEDKSKYVNQETCVNKVDGPNGSKTSNHVFCSTKPDINYKEDEMGKNVLYKSIFGKNEQERQKETAQKLITQMHELYSVGKKPAGTPYDGISFTETAMIEDFIDSHLDDDAIFKMMMNYKMLEQCFGDNDIQPEEMKDYAKDIPDKMYGVDVSFPWATNNIFATPEDRRKCLFTHLTQSNLGDNYKSNDLYEKCFICKNCTLANTSFKAWERLFSNLFISPKKDFKNISHDLFNIMKKNFTIELLPIKQYYLLTLISMCIIHPALDLRKLKAKFQHENKMYMIRDLILGIPAISINVQLTADMKNKLRETYMMMKMMDMENILYKKSFEIMFRKLLKMQDSQQEERLHEIREQIMKRFKVFYGKTKMYNFLNESDISEKELSPYFIFQSNEKLRNMSNNTDVFSPNDIDMEANQCAEKLVPLFQLLLDGNKYSKVETYENTKNNLISNFKQIIQKLNVKDEEDIISSNNQDDN